MSEHRTTGVEPYFMLIPKVNTQPVDLRNERGLYAQSNLKTSLIIVALIDEIMEWRTRAG